MIGSSLRSAGIIIGLTLLAGNAFALGGCVDSPENPSLVLGLLGASAASVPWLRAKVRARFGR